MWLDNRMVGLVEEGAPRERHAVNPDPANPRKHEKKVLFVILDNYKTERVGIQILSTIAIQEGYDRDILILNSMSMEEAILKAKAYQPDIVAYSAMTYEHIPLQEFNGILKAAGLDFVSIFGGMHYTFNSDEMKNDRNIDVICRGEGEVAWRSFIQSIRDGKEYLRIDKLTVRDGEEIIENPVGKLISDMDIIPRPDRTLIPLSDIENDHIQGKSMLFMFGRGCPQKCSYCFNVNYNDLFSDSRVFRLRSVDSVIAEMKEAVETYNLDLVIIHDDIFSYIPKQVMKEFCQRYKAEINLPFVAQFRPESVKEEMVIMLKDAGLYLAPMGVECGDEEIARGILDRGKITNQHIIKAFELFHKHGVKTWSLNLMALPVEDPLSVDWQTIDLNIKIKPFWSQWNIMVPIPHTPMWNHLIENNRYLDLDSFLKADKMPSGFTKTLLNYKDPFMARQVNNLHKFAGIVVKYPFLRPLVKILIRLPENRVYQYIFFFWYGYWKTIGSFNAKFSVKLVVNGLKAIKKYLKRH